MKLKIANQAGKNLFDLLSISFVFYIHNNSLEKWA